MSDKKTASRVFGPFSGQPAFSTKPSSCHLAFDMVTEASYRRATVYISHTTNPSHSICSAFLVIVTLLSTSTLVDIIKHRSRPTAFGTQHISLVLAAWGPFIVFGMLNKIERYEVFADVAGFAVPLPGVRRQLKLCFRCYR